MTAYRLEDTILNVEGISKSFNGKKVLNNVSFEIKDIIRDGFTTGQIQSLIGKSGTGKTVLFNILAGFMTPDSGTVTLNFDSAANKLVESGDVGVVPQNYILLDHYNIKKNLMLACKKSGYDEAYMMELVQKFELEQHLDKYPTFLSGGQRQRVSILQQVLAGHEFILMDEPFSGLDYPMIQKVTTLIKDIANLSEKNTILIVSHDIETSLSISDKAFLLKKISDEEGATITNIYDIKAMGLAWQENIQDNPDFQQLVSTVRHNL